MLWGLHNGGWMSGLTSHAEDRLRAHLELMHAHELHTTGTGISALLELPEERRAEVADLLRSFDIHMQLGVRVDFLCGDAERIKRETNEAIKSVETLAPMMRSLYCSTGISREYHHYSRDMAVDRQIDTLSETMAPLARACENLGYPLLVHTVTHFGSDLAELCRRVPGLGLLYDTANCFLIGEPPLQQAEACAPHTRAVHFKDHYAAPSFRPLGLRARGAVPGRGDVNLREVYRILREKAPEPDRLAIELEIDPVHDENGEMRDRGEVLQEALSFIRSL